MSLYYLTPAVSCVVGVCTDLVILFSHVTLLQLPSIVGVRAPRLDEGQYGRPCRLVPLYTRSTAVLHLRNPVYRRLHQHASVQMIIHIPAFRRVALHTQNSHRPAMGALYLDALAQPPMMLDQYDDLGGLHAASLGSSTTHTLVLSGMCASVQVYRYACD